MLLSSLIHYMEANKGLDSRQLTPEEVVMEVEEYLDPLLKYLSTVTDTQLEREFRVPFGSGGPPEYYYRLCRVVKETFVDFCPEGMDDWEAEQSEERIETADRKIKDLNVKVQAYIFEVLKEKYGVANDAYWHRGVTDKKIKTRAYEKSLDDDDDVRLPLENYLDFIEYKKIVENKVHWPLFSQVFDIVEPGEKGYSKNLRWMERVNELRRIAAHPTEGRHYRLDDFEYIDCIYDEFLRRLAAVRGEDIGDEALA